MDRFDKIRCLLDKGMRGLEIGPSHSPIAPKCEGWQVETIDHASREQLVEKYRAHNVDLSKIETVDWVWNGQPLDELLGSERCGTYDFFIASHVIEHYPDLLGFVKDVEKLLRVDGVLSLAIPDKRYCFDFFKPLTLTGSILAANRNKQTRHSKRVAFEHVAYNCSRDSAGAWDRRQAGELGLVHTLEEAFGLFSDLDESATAEYVDFHTWFFVPSSFQLIIEELRLLGETTFEIARTFDTAGCEFYVSLRKTGLRSQEPPGSPEATARRLALLKQIVREMSEQVRADELVAP